MKKVKTRVFDQCEIGKIHLILYFIFFHNSFEPKRWVHILILVFLNQCYA